MTDSIGSFGELRLNEFADRLASDAPVPGGGSASAVAGALAASLLAMVTRLSLDRPKYEQFRFTNEQALDVAERARKELMRLADADAAAYADYMNARHRPKETADEQAARNAATQAAARRSAEAPLAVVRECAQLIEQIEAVAGRSNLNAASDLEGAARLCSAAARGAGANVLINLPSVGDARFAGVATVELEDLLHRIDRQTLQVSQRVARATLRGPEKA
jgi:formiminotetrahydrofolate cyclodeaminase